MSSLLAVLHLRRHGAWCPVCRERTVGIAPGVHGTKPGSQPTCSAQRSLKHSPTANTVDRPPRVVEPAQPGGRAGTAGGWSRHSRVVEPVETTPGDLDKLDHPRRLDHPRAP